MTNTDILKKLFIAFAKDDKEEFYRLAEEYIEREKKKKHNIVAKELKEALYSSKISTKSIVGRNYKNNIPIPRDTEKGFPLVEIKEYELDLDSLILPEETFQILNQIIKEFRDADILATYNLKPKNKILFCGPPGTGKTYSAQVISSVLNIPLIYVRFDSIISSYLGETAANLRKVFDFIENGTWVVLFDEVDIIGKNRDDHYEHGEIKRVVNNFLQMLDTFEGSSLIIAATNHQHILDPAIWRRFDEIVYFDLPGESERLKLFELYLKPIKKNKIDLLEYAKKTEGFSPSDIKMACIEAIKYAILNDKDQLTPMELDYALSRFKERMNIRNRGRKK
ncbi:MAG: hypothetical protein PWQ34_2136 [Caldanaerobacter sp.]|uniref:AAA family ATPase n=1 Tax=Caldanaerobacter sp. TaxID=2930036 RepID=UPI0024AB69ED|nr:ATP-binding protein [Caldanaerobacter sp.]MDI3519989.1 hypothetical protein [Caldanaerobacter sp.]